eukprot:TRINITY_DN28379_c0_g1_i1.p1 TRINITY_DN28379_c0_g1~~TRINITY_DN28379_c0_g1_i1.p1  ORF type:complete len:626 (-),score=181.04 TRINITY_DN28379_c0_g1_i1:12-1889(-)
MARSSRRQLSRIDLDFDEDPLHALEKAMRELDTRLQEVREVASIIELDGAIPKKPVAGGKSSINLQIAAGGAAVLAEEVAEELKEWREHREVAYTARRLAQQRKHADLLASKRQEEEDKKKLHGCIREILLQEATGILSGPWGRGSSSLSSRAFGARKGNTSPIKLSTAAAQLQANLLGGQAEPEEPQAAAGAHALSKLLSHLDMVTSKLEALEPEQPAVMAGARAEAMAALERKRERVKSVIQKQRFTDKVANADGDLLDEAERGFKQRREAQQEQAKRLMQLLRCVKSAADHRQQAFEALDRDNQTGTAPLPKASWKQLLPSKQQRGGEDDDSEEEGLFAHTLSQAGGRAKLRQEVLAWGEDRIKELCAGFSRRYLTLSDRSHQAKMAESNLEIWRLESRIALLEECRKAATEWHKEKLASLDGILKEHGSSKGQTTVKARALAEKFLRVKSDSLKAEQSDAEEQLATHSRERGELLQAWQRKTELQALKRQASGNRHAEKALQEAHNRSVAQLGQALHRLVAESRSALPLPEPAGVTSEEMARMKTCPLLLGWEKLALPTAKRFEEIDSFLQGLPESAETCALEQGLLSVLDEELQYLCTHLRADASEGPVGTPTWGTGDPL